MKIPSDCPLIDPARDRRVVGPLADEERRLRQQPPPADAGPTGTTSRSSVDVLETAWCEATRTFEREHTTPFVWDQPERFRLANVVWEWGLDLSATHRLTLDYHEDYQVIAAVFDALYRPGAPPSRSSDIAPSSSTSTGGPRDQRRPPRASWMSRHLHELRTLGRPRPPRGEEAA